jgi:nicotinate phosphoribosyltransferase
VFEFFVRNLPETRNFLVAAGLEQVLDYLRSLQFAPHEIGWLESTRRFSPAFLQRLERFRFRGNVVAMREGTAFFASEPVLRVIAPLPEAQMVESRIINLLHYQTLVASKAVRCRLAAPSAQLIDFGMRRAHGAEAACLASRASYLAGFDATATVEAARRYGIPVAGTMAHSFVQAHPLELDAFRNFARSMPKNITLLIDTYDIARGAQRAAELAEELRAGGVVVDAVRIDSGDLPSEATKVRKILDNAGCADTRILVSGGVDEYEMAKMRTVGAPVDAFCVGTRLSVSEDAPALDCAYKLQEYAGRPCRKHSLWKETWPGARQVFRQYDPHGQIATDVLACADEAMEGKALLHEVMLNGERLAPSPPLSQVRDYCRQEVETLPMGLRSLHKGPRSPVKVSPQQHALVAAVDRTEH